MSRDAKAMRAVFDDAEELFSAADVAAAYDSLATQVSAELADADPLLICVLMGGLVTTAELSRRLQFPHQLDYLHATRYRGQLAGGELHWIATPRLSLQGRTILIVDDIFDEGITLEKIAQECKEMGAERVLTAVLVRKRHKRPTAGLKVDFVGLEIDDRYVFGCGMDVKEYWRQLPAIYALQAADS